jgi:hypothetical protein
MFRPVGYGDGDGYGDGYEEAELRLLARGGHWGLRGGGLGPSRALGRGRSARGLSGAPVPLLGGLERAGGRRLGVLGSARAHGSQWHLLVPPGRGYHAVRRGSSGGRSRPI